MNDIIEDNRSKKFVFVPFCSLAQAFHAQGLAKYEWKGAIKPVIQELVNSDVNIIQMPCAETFFFGIDEGLRRSPMGRDKYNTPEFHAFCQDLAKQVFSQVVGLINNGYEVVAILGLEYSPSCAADLQYTRKGTIHQKGFFIDELSKLLQENNIQIPFVGINRRGMNKTMSNLRETLSPSKQLDIFGE